MNFSLNILVRIVESLGQYHYQDYDEDFPASFLGRNSAKNKLFCRARYALSLSPLALGTILIFIYTPTQAHSRVFVTGGEFFARQKVTELYCFLGEAS